MRPILFGVVLLALGCSQQPETTGTRQDFSRLLSNLHTARSMLDTSEEKLQSWQDQLSRCDDDKKKQLLKESISEEEKSATAYARLVVMLERDIQKFVPSVSELNAERQP